ncbi:MAG: CaiB/BaiF CoA-transferase family protein [Pseudomonadota bacterium]
MSTQSAGALAGLRILDLTRILAGPTCTQLFGDLGAEILKIERPGAGDDTRKWGPPFVKDPNGADTAESAYYLCANRNKKSVAVDISDPKGADLIRSLLAHCDVLMENFKVGGLKAYGLSYEDLKDEFPRLVYCSITGFGQTGPNKDKPGYDVMAQGYGGIMSLTGAADGEPMKVGVGVADIVCGLYAGNAVLAALRHRDATGEGQHIDLSLVDSQIAWLINEGTNYLTSGLEPLRRGNAHPNIVPYQTFETADGHAIVAVGNDAQYRRFCAVIGRPELGEDPRYATNTSRLAERDALIPELAAAVRTITTDALLSALAAEKVPAGPVHTLPQVFATDQVAAREMKITMDHPASGSGTVDLIGNPLKLSKTPVTYRHAPPVCGADTDSVISQLLGDDALAEARAAGIIG